MAQRYLITGGAGFLGINLCRHLLGRGAAVRSLDKAPFGYPERTRIEALRGDVRTRVEVERAVRGADVIIHAATAPPLAPLDEIFSTAISGTRLVLDAALAQGVTRVIFISSARVYGATTPQALREDGSVVGADLHAQSKIRAEGMCRAARERGLIVSILRPQTIVGPERLGAFELLYDWAYSGRNFPVLGSGRNCFQLLDVEDLCRAIELCATRAPEEVNDTFNVGVRRCGTLRESFQAVLDRAGHGRRVVSLPAAPAIATLRVLKALRLSPLFQWIYQSATQESFVSVERLERRFGFVPRYDNTAALIRNYDWYLAHRPEIGSACGRSYHVPRRTGALRVAKYLF
jgi:nucleoside-diphosphate-sugar epimerase